ncbi:alpha/beta-hydrolase [Xylariomycetidae sp. FL0641]|nr:alpha/beta-hydrolase [Xylariomycetidae sp. FL0641]
MHLRIPDGHDRDRVPVSPASPEVISSLITSLSVISRPANHHSESPYQSMSSSPGDGSFGVEYGSFTQSSLGRLQEEGLDLDELAACPPTIRTAKPPSGFSALTAPKSPRSPRLELSGGLKSLLRNPSRPSSMSSASSHEDTRSIGNVSIEPGQPPTPELRRQKSYDSWGKKLNRRNSKGLMYMSSRERLRASDSEKKRLNSGGKANSFDALSPRQDPILAEIPISEEPIELLSKDSYPTSRESFPNRTSSISTNTFTQQIPARESSLRKTGSNAKRPSHRPRAQRGSDGNLNDMIPEDDEHSRSYDMPKRHQRRQSSEPNTHRRNDSARSADMAIAAKASGAYRNDRGCGKASGYSSDMSPFDDGAPFPTVTQTRRRESRSADRLRSGHTSPEPGDKKPKRSASRMKRMNRSPDSSDRKKDSSSLEPTVGYERPTSADSIDDAVESYLCSPRLSQKIRHPQTGRVISFSEVGDADGSAVFCCVGMGLTRYITAFYDELALTLKLRLITPDRPGVGDSEPYADGTATPLSWPDDVYAICQALKITKFSMLAHSAGAIYALATALRMPQHIRGRIHLLAPWIPPSQMHVFGSSQALPPANAIPTAQRILRALPTPFLKAANSSFMSATSTSITSSLPHTKAGGRARRKAGNAAAAEREEAARNRREAIASLEKEAAEAAAAAGGGMPDAAANFGALRRGGAAEAAADDDDMQSPPPPIDPVLLAAADAMADRERQSTYDARLTSAIWELATTGANPAVDLLVCLERRHTIGFRYVDITRPVVIHHGARDSRVPVDNVVWLGKTMRRCEVRVLEQEGHGLMASAQVMGSVLVEISKEWEDWTRLTQGKRGEGERGRALRATAR